MKTVGAAWFGLVGLVVGCGTEGVADESEPWSPSDARVIEAPSRDDAGLDGESTLDSTVQLDGSGDANASSPAADGGFDPRDPVQVIPVQDPSDLGLPTYPINAAGDLLISRTGRGCLSVDASAKLVAGSTVSLNVCRGLPGQRWSIATSGVSLAEAPELCLDGASGKAKLSRCADITQFKLASDGVIERASTALDVTSDGELITYGTHRGTNQRWSRLSQDLTFLEQNKAKTVSYPLPASDTLGYELEEARHRVGMVQPPYPLQAARDVSKFPGSVPADAPMISRRVHMDTRFDHDTGYLRVSWPPENWQSTGVYAPAGKIVVLSVPEGVGAGLFVRINGHTDELEPDSGNVKGESFERMPRVSMRVQLTAGNNVVRSPYGGEVIIESERDTGGVITIDIHGGVEMPRFVLGVTSAAEWTRMRALNMPWAELEGDKSVITVPSAQIKTLTNPDEVMKRYDRVVTLTADLFGIDAAANSGVHRAFDGKARWVSDVQITAGYGHSGYPIMTTNDWKLADSKTGGDEWGIWHELGHNHQQFCLWSSRFGTETTVNLFSLYVQDTVHSTSRIQNDYSSVIAALEANTMKWDTVDDPWKELVFLMQPVHAFPSIGWDLYRRVNRAYRELPAAERTSVCNSSALQLDTFYKILSKAANADLRDHFTRWGFTLSQAALDSVTASGLKAPSVVVWRAKR